MVGFQPEELAFIESIMKIETFVLHYQLSTIFFTAPLVLIQRSSFCLDSSIETDPPTVPRRSKEIYGNFVAMARRGPQPPANRDLLMYRKFASFS